MSITEEMMTPTQREIVQRHRSFRQSIADKAAALARAKAPPAAPVMPEAVPAEPDPPEKSEPPLLRHWFEIKQIVPSVAAIQTAVAKYYGISRADLLSTRRTKDVIMPRHIAVYLAKELTPFSLPALGRYFGGRDHSTQLNAIQKITRLVREDAEIAFHVSQLMVELTGSPL